MLSTPQWPRAPFSEPVDIERGRRDIEARLERVAIGIFDARKDRAPSHLAAQAASYRPHRYHGMASMLTPITTIKVAAVSSVNSQSIAFHRHLVWPHLAAALSYALVETFGRVIQFAQLECANL